MDPFSTRHGQRALVVLVLASLLLFGFSATLDAQIAGAPIVVDNPSSFARNLEPVASGLAVPQAVGLTNIGSLCLLNDQGQAVPAQFKSLVRWNGWREDPQWPVKWLLVEFLADVPANASRTYYLSVGANPAGQIVVNDSLAATDVDTGAAHFQIDKTAFRLIKSVSIGQTVVADAGTTAALDMLDASGVLATATLTSTVIEESGSVRTVVRQKGTISNGGLEFTIRYFFWSGRADVKVEWRLENNQSYGLPDMGGVAHNAHFDQLHLSLRLNGNATSAQTSSSNYALGASAFELRQNWTPPNNPLQMLQGFSFTETLAGTLVGSGGRHLGAVAAQNGTGAIAAVVDRFWQNFPKSFTVSGNKLSLGLYPTYGNGPEFTGQYGLPNSPIVDGSSLNFYRFEGGRWKTDTFWLSYRAGAGFSQLELAEMAERTNKPLMARWVDTLIPFAGFVFGQLVVPRIGWTDPGLQRYERIMDILVDDSAADFQDTLGQIAFPAFRNRGGTYGGSQMYGWENFGDIAWGDGYSSLHYDMNWGVLINYVRTGDYDFFDIGRDLAAHRRDYDQYHSKSPTDVSRGGQFYEKGYFHGNYTEPTPSHTWVHGLLLYYALTGDEGSREAAIEVGDFVIRTHPETWDGWWGARILGWSLENLVDLWNYTGISNYKTIAAATAARWAYIEGQNGGLGYVINPGYQNPHAEVWMHGIVMNALVKYFWATHDPSASASITRMADWFMQSCIASNPIDTGSLRPVGKVWTDWAPGFQNGASIHHCWVMLDALANAAAVTGTVGYYVMADALFDSNSRFFQGPPDDEGSPTPGLFNYNDPQNWCVIAFRMLGYPNSESKILSNIARWGHSYLTLRYVFFSGF